jgi:hypothetical protein
MGLAPMHDQSMAPAPEPAAPKAIGSGEGTASLLFSLIAPASMYYLTAPFSLLAALFTRPDEGPGRLDWVAPLVLWSYPVLFGVLAVTLGVVALRVFVPRSNGWRAGVAALWISGVEVAIALVLVLRHGHFMILF